MNAQEQFHQDLIEYLNTDMGRELIVAFVQKEMGEITRNDYLGTVH